jgi:hypothetical protein
MNEYIIPVLSLVIGLSGWGKVLYDLVTSRPKIRGRVFQVIRAQMEDPRKKGANVSAFIAYLYLVNKRRNTIHVLDYEMEIKVGKKWTRLLRVYGIQNVKNSFKSISGSNIEINNFENNLIYMKNKPVEYGTPLHGWIVFVGPDYFYNNKSINAFRLTCIDAFQGRHRIVTEPNEFANVYLLRDIADIKMKDQFVYE